MDVNNISIPVGKYGALPSVAPNVGILLVDHDTTSLMSLASQFEQLLYRVTSTESADIALSLFQAGKNYYNIVIADLHMPKMEIYKFVQKLQQLHKNIPVILMAENVTTDLVREARGYGVCYLFSKPINCRDIATLWQHIYRVTGEMPLSTDTTYNVEKYGICDGAASKQKQRKLDYTPGRACQIPRSPSGLKPSIFAGYTLDYVKQILDASNYSSNDNVNANISDGGFEIPEGCGEVQICPSIDQNLSINENPNAYIRTQPQVFPQSNVSLIPASSLAIPTNGHAIPASGYLSNGLETPNSERPGATTGDMLSSNHLTHGFQAPNQGPTGAITDVILASGLSSNSSQALNQESAGVFWMNNDNFGEGTSANEEFDGKNNNDSINQIIQEFEASGVNIWELINL